MNPLGFKKKNKGIIMNTAEKKALFSFLTIYIAGITFLMAIIASLYYNKESKMLMQHCSMQMGNAALNIKADIMKAVMDNTPYNFRVKDQAFQYALFDKEKNEVFSNLRNQNLLDLSKEALHTNEGSFHVLKLDDKKIDLEYIVVEDTQTFNDVFKLKLLIAVIFVISFIFMIFIGYFLSKILLHPIKEKTQQLNRFVKDSSHELNTPISALLMSLPSLKKAIPHDDKTIRHISVSTKNIKQAYDRLLFNLNHDTVTKYNETFDLAKLVKESIHFFDEIAASKFIHIHETLNSCMVHMDKYSAQMLIHNLLSNAIKYSRKHKNIYINFNEHELSIKDEGIGMDAKTQKEVFKRFSRGSEEEGGFGMGLDIVQSICKEYHIKLTLCSEENCGSNFTLDFQRIKP